MLDGIFMRPFFRDSESRHWEQNMNQKKRTFITSALIALAFLLTSAFAGAELPLRTISLSPDEEIKASSYQVAAGKAVRIQNDMDRVLHNTSISRMDPDKHMLSVQTFHPGQSMDLEFSAQGRYRICYDWAPEQSNAVQRSCVRLNVVKLQAT